MMIGTPYNVQRYSIQGKNIVKRELGSEAKISEMLHDNTKDMYQLKQVIPMLDGGDTGDILFISEYNPELIHTDIFFESDMGEACDDQYLTASHLKLIRDIGYIEIDQKKYKVEDIKISWSTEKIGVCAVIETSTCDDE